MFLSLGMLMKLWEWMMRIMGLLYPSMLLRKEYLVYLEECALDLLI